MPPPATARGSGSAAAYYSSFHATSHVYSYYDGFTALFGTNNLADNHRLLNVDQYALFGETSYEMPEPPEVDRRASLLHVPQQFGYLRQRCVGERHQRYAASPTRKTPA